MDWLLTAFIILVMITLLASGFALGVVFGMRKK